MEKDKSYVRLGLFVTVTVVIITAILFLLGGRSLFEPTFTFETYFKESVAGLEIGAPVNFRGIPLGHVVEIQGTTTSYEKDKPIDKRLNYIIVRAKLSGNDEAVTGWKRDLDAMVKNGLRAQTQLAGITGQQYLALDILDPAAYPPLPHDWTPKLPYVPSSPSLTGEIVDNARQFIASLNKADIPLLGRNLNKLVVTLNDKTQSLPVKELATEAVALLKSAHATFDSANGILADPGLKKSVDNAAQITDRLRNLADSGSLDLMVKNMNDVAARIDGMVGDNQYDVRAIVQDLRVTSGNLRTLSETFKRDPAGVLLGGPPDKVQIPGRSP